MSTAENTTWFEDAKRDAVEFAAKTKAPVIGYAYQSEHTRGRGYFRTDRREPQAAKLRRMIAKIQKRGIRAEIFEIGGETA